MDEYFEPMMSMLLAASLGAIAAVATVRYSVIDKSFAAAAVVLWLYIMNGYYDWNWQELDVVSFFPPLLIIPLVTYGAQLLLGILVLAMTFTATKRFLTGHAGSGTA